MTFDDLRPLIDWLQANPGWAGFATFIISIAESLAVIGLLIPGTLVMGAIGTLIGSGVLPGVEITLWAIGGAIVGDGMSYWLGHHYHGHIREIWPFRSYPALLRRGESFFLKYGGMSVFMGRFIGPIRPIIPVVAGMMNMPPSRFTLANVGSAIAWAPAYMMPGIILGALSVQLAPQTGTRFLVIAIVTLLLLWMACWFLKIVCQFLARRLSLLTAFIGSVVLLLAFTAYIYCGNTISLNAGALDAMVSIRFDLGDTILSAVALLEKTVVLATFFLAVFGFLCFKKQRRAAKYWLILGVVTTGIAVSGYPSHAIALYTALFGYLAVILAEKWTDARTWIYTTAIILIGVICFADLYIAIHSFTAVLGGILLGFCTLLGTLFFYRRCYTLPVPATGSLLIIALLSILISWSGAYYRYYPGILEQYTPLILPPTVLNTETWWSTGHSTQGMNIQWAGSLKNIELELRAAGWEVVPKADFTTIVNRIAAKNRYEQLPLFPRIYLNRKAELIMTLKVGNPQRLLVLRLWDANLLLDTPGLPIWLGSLEYHKPWQAPRFLNAKKKAEPEPVLPSAMDVLSQALTNFTAKSVPTSEGTMLLIISKTGS